MVSTSATIMTAHDTRYSGLCSTPSGSVMTTLSLMMNSTMATICVTVLALPYQLAAMTTPWLAATIRMPETMNSRVRMTSATHEGRTEKLHQGQKRGRHQYLVGQGIHELAEVRHLVAAAGQIAVQAVGRRQKDEDARRDPRLPRLGVAPLGEPRRPGADDGHHEHRHAADAHKRHDVRRRPQLLARGAVRSRLGHASSPSISYRSVSTMRTRTTCPTSPASRYTTPSTSGAWHMARPNS